MEASKFRTTEYGEVGHDAAGLKFITIKSKNLKGRGDILVYDPPGDHSDLPLITLLHGVYGSAWVWAMKGKAHVTASKIISEGKIQPMAIAMPSDGLWGDGSGYNEHDSRDFEKWIAEDVPLAVAENTKAVSSKSIHFISGLSMGGFGALRIGAKYPHQYSGISGHSSITAVDQLKLFVEEPLESFKQAKPADENAFAAIAENKDSLPPLRFDCGEADPLIEPNRKLQAQLEEEGIAHHYEEFEGGHEWSYWERHFADTLLFFQTILAHDKRGSDDQD